ncbi:MULTISPECIES: SDR family NAD(P)-dependent oxidoreductase [unclassified Lysobacter]|uniref:SDR family NAD(P)-dependent oxidoreductase n=1 Tax=unclassified Lysobacter TaxID=2635362 RepID=UPI001C2260A9|nr:SDR family NAD(P)-dependent oxidoreductase [Lysobacter sp. MMG2]MBU8975640.1 SDR family oxidoreductase [Lysobacter sp. MMG2]
MSLKDQVIVVTGASRGIGRAIALHCAGQGAQLVLVARDADALQGVADECLAAGGPEPHCASLDLTRDDGIPALFQDLFARYRKLDGLVNNAGILHEGVLGMIRPDDIDRVLAVNVKAPLMLMQYAARLMTRNKRGSIVNLVSIMGVQGAAGLTLYSASKAAMIGATLSASKELAPRGIRVNAVSPGFIDTDMTREMPEAAHAARVASIGLGRAGTPQEVAQLVAFLLDDASAYVSGQVVGIDGRMVV